MPELNWIDEIEASIEESARTQHIPLRKLDERDAALVKNTGRRRFVDGEPRVWWLGLSRPIVGQYDRRSVDLNTVLPSNTGSCWLIPENERRPVYEVDASLVKKLLDECLLFEYNIIARDFDWLVAETGHDMIYVCRSSTPSS